MIPKVGEKFYKIKESKFWNVGQIFSENEATFRVLSIEEVEIDYNTYYRFEFLRLPDTISIYQYDIKSIWELSFFKRKLIIILFSILMKLFTKNDLSIIKRPKYVFNDHKSVQHGTFYRIKDFKCWNINEYTWENDVYYRILDIRDIDGMYLYKLYFDGNKTTNIRVILQNFISDLIFKLY